MEASAEVILPLLVAGNRYALDNLVYVCEGLIRSNLDLESCSYIYHLADMYSLTTLKKLCLSIILRDFEAFKLQCEAQGGEGGFSEELMVEIEKYRHTAGHAFAHGLEKWAWEDPAGKKTRQEKKSRCMG